VYGSKILGYQSDAYQTWLFGELEKERRQKKEAGLLSAIRSHLPSIPSS
jgi:hypothetical protein